MRGRRREARGAALGVRAVAVVTRRGRRAGGEAHSQAAAAAGRLCRWVDSHPGGEGKGGHPHVPLLPPALAQVRQLGLGRGEGGVERLLVQQLQLAHAACGVWSCRVKRAGGGARSARAAAQRRRPLAPGEGIACPARRSPGHTPTRTQEGERRDEEHDVEQLEGAQHGDIEDALHKEQRAVAHAPAWGRVRPGVQGVRRRSEELGTQRALPDQQNSLLTWAGGGRGGRRGPGGRAAPCDTESGRGRRSGFGSAACTGLVARGGSTACVLHI